MPSALFSPTASIDGLQFGRFHAPTCRPCRVEQSTATLLAVAEVVLRVRLIGWHQVDVTYEDADTADVDEVVERAVSVLAEDAGLGPGTAVGSLCRTGAASPRWKLRHAVRSCDPYDCAASALTTNVHRVGSHRVRSQRIAHRTRSGLIWDFVARTHPSLQLQLQRCVPNCNEASEKPHRSPILTPLPSHVTR